MSTKSAIVLVHGAWHSPKHFDPLTRHLREAGYEVVLPSLPSMWAEDPSKITSLDPDIQTVREAILSVLKTNDVFLVAHSYGAIPSTASLKDLDTKSRTSQGNRTSVVGYAIIAGLLIPEGMGLIEFFGDRPAAVHNVDTSSNLLRVTDPPGPSYWFYQDCPPDVAIEASNCLVPQAWAVNTSKSPFGGHYHVPTSYLVCKRDNVMPAFLQRMMVDRAREDVSEKEKPNHWIKAGTIESGHSPFLSMTERTGLWIRRCIGEQVEVDGIEMY